VIEIRSHITFGIVFLVPLLLCITEDEDNDEDESDRTVYCSATQVLA
jgi:hypothetical protein